MSQAFRIDFAETGPTWDEIADLLTKSGEGGQLAARSELLSDTRPLE